MLIGLHPELALNQDIPLCVDVRKKAAPIYSVDGIVQCTLNRDSLFVDCLAGVDPEGERVPACFEWDNVKHNSADVRDLNVDSWADGLVHQEWRVFPIVT